LKLKLFINNSKILNKSTNVFSNKELVWLID